MSGATELKPCPFCGGAAYPRGAAGWNGVGCLTDKCPAYLYALMFRTAEEAVAAWNRRTPDVSTAAPAASSPVMLNRRAEVEQLLFDVASGKRPSPTPLQCRHLAMRLGDPTHDDWLKTMPPLEHNQFPEVRP